MKKKRQWRVEVARSAWVGVNGPDYVCDGEHRVVDANSGEVVLVFTEDGDWPFMCGESFTGTASVVVAPDGSHVIVTGHDGNVTTAPLPD